MTKSPSNPPFSRGEVNKYILTNLRPLAGGGEFIRPVRLKSPLRLFKLFYACC